MSTIQGFNIEDFINYNPPKNTIAISFASKLDHQYDQQLYAKLPDQVPRNHTYEIPQSFSNPSRWYSDQQA